MRIAMRTRPIASLVAVILLAQAAISQAQEDVTRVNVQEVEQRALQQQVPITGSISSPRIAALSSQVSGLVTNLTVDAGDSVEKNQILLELDPELSEIALARAEAELAQARATQADSERRFQEAKELAANSNIAASEVRAREAQLAIDSAAVQVIESQLREQQALLRRHQLRAPFAGTVSQRMADDGEWITPGTPVLELIDTQNLRIDFQIPQRFYAKVDQETLLSLTIDAFPDQEFEAQVHRKVPLSGSAGRTFLLRALFTSQPPQIIPGMSVSGQLQVDLDRTGPVVPRDTVRRYPDGRTSVWVLTERDGNQAQVTEKQVQTGLVFGDQIEIRSGLEPGRELVTRGNEGLQEGQTVHIE